MEDVKQMSLLEILDKNVDQVQLGKDLLAKYASEKFAELEAKIASGEIDLIKGTNLDEVALKAIMSVLKQALGL